MHGFPHPIAVTDIEVGDVVDLIHRTYTVDLSTGRKAPVVDTERVYIIAISEPTEGKFGVQVTAKTVRTGWLARYKRGERVPLRTLCLFHSDDYSYEIVVPSR